MNQFWQPMNELLSQKVWGMMVYEYLLSVIWLVLGVIVLWLFNMILIRQLKKWAAKTTTTWDDFLIELIQKRLIPLLYVLLFYVVLKNYPFPELISQILNGALVVAVTISVLLAISTFIKKIINDNELKTINEHQKTAFKGLYPALNTVVWVVGAVFLMDNFGFDITAVVAGLGIGGVAVALAAQAILGDLFSYFAIVLDRPFELGDFIIVGEFMGTVEYIGLKTTRLRSLSGEQVIMANHDLTSSRVRNYKRMFQRRVVFRLGILYETPLEKVSLVPQLIQQAIEQQADVRFDRSHFFQYGPYSLEFESVYFVLDGDYNHYMDVQQAINLAILKLFQANNIQFAYPTQVLYMHTAGTS